MVIALGFFVVFRVSKFYYIGHGAVIVAAGITLHTYIHVFGFSVPVGILGACVVSSAVAYTFHVVAHRRLRRKDASSLLHLLASFALLLIVDNVILLVFGGAPRRVLRPITESAAVGALSWPDLGLVTVAVGVSVLLGGLFRFTDLGKTLRAVGDNDLGAEFVGIDSEYLYSVAFLISGFVGGIAAAAVFYESDLTPGSSVHYGVLGIIPVAIAAGRSVLLTVLAAFGVGLVEASAAVFVGSGWRNFAAYLTLIVFIVLRWGGYLYRGERQQGLV